MPASKDYWTKYEGFLGKGWAFPPAFDRDAQTAAMVIAEDDIRESLYILLSTIPGERIMSPEYGCLIHHHVFDIVGETLFTHLKGLIDHAVLHYEPRIILENVLFNAESERDGRLNITLEYRIVQTNTRNNLVIPFYLKEGTLIALAEAS
ncbi:MAG TPA: GPW/gp25 family protein [Candidatus Angelobacter sp.]|nr:GPW/gp25 family protein [Candidatus Angelobacter sp.]